MVPSKCALASTLHGAGGAGATRHAGTMVDAAIAKAVLMSATSDPACETRPAPPCESSVTFPYTWISSS